MNRPAQTLVSPCRCWVSRFWIASAEVEKVPKPLEISTGEILLAFADFLAAFQFDALFRAFHTDPAKDATALLIILTIDESHVASYSKCWGRTNYTDDILPYVTQPIFSKISLTVSFRSTPVSVSVSGIQVLIHLSTSNSRHIEGGGEENTSSAASWNGLQQEKLQWAVSTRWVGEWVSKCSALEVNGEPSLHGGAAEGYSSHCHRPTTSMGPTVPSTPRPYPHLMMAKIISILLSPI